MDYSSFVFVMHSHLWQWWDCIYFKLSLPYCCQCIQFCVSEATSLLIMMHHPYVQNHCCYSTNDSDAGNILWSHSLSDMQVCMYATVFKIFLFNLCDGTFLDTAATTGLLYQPRMIGEGDSGDIGGIQIGWGNRSTRRKPAPEPLCPPQIPHD
jgi:hypothetical protein